MSGRYNQQQSYPVDTSIQVETSIPPTLTLMLMGKGDRSALVIGGTIARPRSELVCVRILRSASVNDVDNAEFRAWRSGDIEVKLTIRQSGVV